MARTCLQSRYYGSPHSLRHPQGEGGKSRFGLPGGWVVLDARRVYLGVIGVKDKAERHRMANVCVGGLWSPSRDSSAFIDGSSSRSQARQRRLGMRCLVVARLWAHPGPLPAPQSSRKVHKGVYLHACGVAYRWQPKSGRLKANYCHRGA